MSNLIAHAVTELSKLSDGPEQERMNDDLIAMVALFACQEHSGFSASYAIAILTKLLSFQPLTPLTGEDDEWNDVGELPSGGTLFQNKRCSHVFKTDGQAWDNNGKVFVQPDGSRFTSGESRVDITFPYTPKMELVYLDEPKCGGSLVL